VHQVGKQYIVNSWCTVRKTLSYTISAHRKLGSNTIIETPEAIGGNTSTLSWRNMILILHEKK